MYQIQDLILIIHYVCFAAQKTITFLTQENFTFYFNISICAIALGIVAPYNKNKIGTNKRYPTKCLEI